MGNLPAQNVWSTSLMVIPESDLLSNLYWRYVRKSVEITEFYSNNFTWNHFRPKFEIRTSKSVQMTSFVALILPKLISRKIWVKSKFLNFHTHIVEITEILSHTFLVKIAWKSWFHEIFFRWARISRFPHWRKVRCCSIFLSAIFRKNFVKSTYFVLYPLSSIHIPQCEKVL